MSAIENVHARQVFDSRANPTIEVDVRLASGAFGRAAVPSGASTGTREALELRDGAGPFGGKGVSRAAANVNGEISAMVRDHDVSNQRGLDEALIELDGTDGKRRLGANALQPEPRRPTPANRCGGISAETRRGCFRCRP